MIGESLILSISNNNVVLGGHFTRVEPWEFKALYGFRCNPRVIMVISRAGHLCFLPRVRLFFWLNSTARCQCFRLSKYSSGGTKFEIFREHVGYLQFVLLH